MKTTLDLPDDVAETLRLESARRGGRKKASLSRLVTEAVRQVYRLSHDVSPPPIELNPGRVIVSAPSEAKPVDRKDVQHALDD